MPKTVTGARPAAANLLYAPLPILCAIAALGDMAGVMLFPVTPSLMAHFRVSAADAQWTMTAFTLAVSLSQPVTGLLADRFGRRPILLLVLAIFVIASAICVLATSIPMLATGRALQGVGAGAALLLARAMVFAAAPSQQQAARRMGVVITTIGAIGLVAPLAGGVMIERIGWQAPFVLLLVAGVLTFLWALIQIRETRQATEGERRSVLPVVIALLASRSFLGSTVVLTAVTTLFFVAISVLPVLFRTLSPATVGLVASGLGAAFTLGAAVSGPILRRWPLRATVLRLSVLNSGVGVAWLAGGLIAGASLPVFVAGALVFTLICGLVTPMVLASAIEDADTAGTASGLSGAGSVLVTGLLTQAGVALIDQGVVAVMVLAFAITVAGVVGAIAIRADATAA